MESMDNFIDDIRKGDEVRIYLDGTDRTLAGYVWCRSGEEIAEGYRGVFSDDSQIPSLGLKGADILLCSLSPGEISEEEDRLLECMAQFIGINIKEKRISDQPVKGYDIISRGG